MKKLISFYIIMIIMAGSCLNGFADVNVKAAVTTINLTLESSLLQAEKENPEIRLLDKKIELYQKRYSESLTARDNAKDKWSPIESENLAFRKEEKLNWFAKQNDLEEVKSERQSKFDDLKISIKSQYMNILSLQSEVGNIYEEIKKLDVQIKQYETKLKLGQIKEVDLYRIKSQRIQMVSQQTTINRQIDTALIQFKKDLGINMAAKVSLKEAVIPYQILDENNIEQKIKDAVEKSKQLEQAQKDIELSRLERKILVDHTNSALSNQVYNMDLAIGEKELAIESLKLQLEADLWTKYYNLKLQEDTVKIEEINLEIEKVNYNSIEAKTKLGMLDALSELNAKLQLNRQKNNLQRAMNNYMIELESFNADIKR